MDRAAISTFVSFISGDTNSNARDSTAISSLNNT